MKDTNFDICYKYALWYISNVEYFVLEDIRMSFRLKYEDWYRYEQYWGTIINILNSKGVCDLYCSQKVTNNLGKLIKIDLYKTIK